ncbi:hypothetical protein HIR71_07590 [Cellulomonas fimi]|uniref:Uncharacterized protein n=1 Tax=Cellulomonas fimi TaxID=1708 RepID=A0A7Y0LXH9_CELFI|nr:hypothetical protein [Cellulomonas fimi]
MVPGPDAAGEVDLIATAVLGCPAVVALDTGGLRMVATYLPGRRVVGVRTDEQLVEVAVVGALGVPVTGLDRQVRAAVAPYAAGRRVDLHVADLADPSVVAVPVPVPVGLTPP